MNLEAPGMDHSKEASQKQLKQHRQQRVEVFSRGSWNWEKNTDAGNATQRVSKVTGIG